MDEEALQSLLSLASQPAQAQALQYFERLKATENGWELCAEALLSGQYQRDDQVRYFCYQVIEHFVRTRYAGGRNAVCHSVVKSFLINTVRQQVSLPSSDKSFIKNKIAQLWSLVFVVDYPQQLWREFFTDLLAMLPLGEVAVDMYLRILRAIDTEVVDREVAHTDFEQARNTKIKDSMRETCVTQLVESWYRIITGYEVANPSLVCMCLNVVGLYVAWIDILLVANDNFVGILLKFMKNPVLRESACDCINEIICKGMPPVAKMKLIESFTAVLQSAGVMYPTEDEEGDFVAKLSKLVNSIGVSLIGAWGKLVKGNEGVAAAEALVAVQAKLPLLQRFLGDEDDDVSAAVAPFASDYIGLLKQLAPISSLQKESVQALIYILLKKMRYADDYDFDAEDEEEAMFQDYRKHLKMLFNSLASLDGQLILHTVASVLTAALQSWQRLDFAEVEVAITLFYMLGEALPAWSSSNLDLILNLTSKAAGSSPKGGSSGGSSRNGSVATANGSVSSDASILQDMMKMLLASNVSRHTHQAVVLQFFETAIRYEKFFLAQPRYIGDMLAAFLDDRGLRNKSPRVRSRVSYLFTRFTKTVRAHLTVYTEHILKQLEGLLVVSTPSCIAVAGADGRFLQQEQPPWLTSEEQMFLYEVASSLIVTGDFSGDRKSFLMSNLLAPVVQKFQEIYARLCSETDEACQQAFAEALNSIMSFTSRASKGFSMHQTMKVCGCVDVFTTTLKVYVSALDAPCQRALLQQGVRQYFHRMIVCLEEDVLPFVPATVQQLLKSPSARELHDFLPLMNQLVNKFKKALEPFARDAFAPLVATIFHVLASPLDERDTVGLSDKRLLRRSYFQFLSSIISNDLADVIRDQGVHSLREILMTVIQGAVESADPQSQKTCFAILKRLIELWGGKEGVPGFDEFTLGSIVPACFMTPLKDTFDWSDGQTVLVLAEIATCLKAAHEKLDASLTRYLLSDYFPRMSVPPPAAEGICSSLQGDVKKFRSYLKAFYDTARSVS